MTLTNYINGQRLCTIFTIDALDKKNLSSSVQLVAFAMLIE
jgi:hypothetical protein